MKNWQLYFLIANIYSVAIVITENVFMAGISLFIGAIYYISASISYWTDNHKTNKIRKYLGVKQ